MAIVGSIMTAGSMALSMFAGFIAGWLAEYIYAYVFNMAAGSLATSNWYVSRAEAVLYMAVLLLLDGLALWIIDIVTMGKLMRVPGHSSMVLLGLMALQIDDFQAWGRFIVGDPLVNGQPHLGPYSSQSGVAASGSGIQFGVGKTDSKPIGGSSST